MKVSEIGALVRKKDSVLHRQSPICGELEARELAGPLNGNKLPHKNLGESGPRLLSHPIS